MIDEGMLIEAATESGLWEEYEADPKLRSFYMRKLMKRGWAGARSGLEKKYCSAVYRRKYPNLAGG